MIMLPRLERFVALLLLLVMASGGTSTDRHPRGTTTITTNSLPHSITLRGGGASVKKNTQAFLQKNQKQAKAAIKNVSTQAATNTFQWSDHTEAIKGCLMLTGLERVINRIFTENGITFPSQLAGCIGLFFFMILSEILKPGMGVSVYKFFVPGSNLLAKWFPVMFVPGLVMLPLAPSIGDGWEVSKFLGVTVIGLFYSMLTTAYTVQFLRQAQGKSAVAPKPTLAKAKRAVAKKVPATLPTPPKPYRDGTMTFLFRATLISALINVVLTNLGHGYATPARAIFFTLTTFCTYVWGARLPPSFTKVVHPLIVSAFLTLGVIQGTAVATATNFKSCLKLYKIGTYDVLKMGAGDVMMFLLGPSVVSFSISMFDRRKLLQENLFIILVSVFVSSVGGLFGTAAFVRFLQLGGKIGGGMVRLSTLSRNVTTALAIACTNALKGDVSLAILIVLMTGVLGATVCRSVLDALGIHDPVTRGLAVGGSAQGLGVTSMIPEADAFPFAAMSMILTAISATIMVSIPSIRDALVNLSQGNL